MSPLGTCAVCGRTILDGEQVHSFVSAQGRHEVCTLCSDRAAELGWLPADEEGAEERLRSRTEPKPGFFSRLFVRPEPADDDPREMTPPPPSGPRRATHELETERYDVEAEWRGDAGDEGEQRPSRRRRLTGRFAPAPRGSSADLPAPEAPPADLPAPDAPRVTDLPAPEASAPGDAPSPTDLPAPDPSAPNDLPSATDLPAADARPPAVPEAAPAPDATASAAPLPDPAGRGMRPRRLQPDLSPTTRFERAIDRFNAGDAGRTVAGLTRTLGAPSVSVGDLAGATDEVRVTVAWELTWYQWGVDLGDELRPVYELKKGFEIEEIDPAARQWNASAHDGRIVMVAPRGREAANGRPVHR
ncbi:MAG TPA: hypothetical protein VH268_03285 [Solirubrobacterales bacterium]|nr:hypothetical protein [Solirubrobacterales bacterium]